MNTFRTISLLFSLFLLVVSIVDKLRPIPRENTVVFYLILLIAISSFNFVRFYRTRKGAFEFNLFNTIPTAASVFRAVTCLLLSIPIVVANYSIWLSYAYLGYYLLISAFYDHAEYHKEMWRRIRTFFDFIFAVLIFMFFDKLKIVSWLPFLIPISVISRYNNPRIAYLSGIGSIIFISLFPFLAESKSLILPAGLEMFNPFEVIKANRNIWSNFESIFVADMIILLAVAIYHTETKGRIMRVFDFGRYLEYYKQQFGTKIDRKLLNLLCCYLNAEAVIAIQNNLNGNPKIVFSFQSHSHTEPFLSHEGQLSAEFIAAYKTEIVDKLLDNSEICESCMPPNRALWKYYFERLLRKDKKKNTANTPYYVWKSLKIKDIKGDMNFLEFYAPRDNSTIQAFQDLFFSKSPMFRVENHQGNCLVTFRDAAQMYPYFEIVSFIISNIKNWTVFVVNNFPNDFRIVPRRFQEDGLEKIDIFIQKFS
jgi:hypothetical protein